MIRLDQNNIAGELPPSWSALTGLRTLTLWDNKLTGEIPESWANLQVRMMACSMAVRCKVGVRQIRSTQLGCNSVVIAKAHTGHTSSEQIKP